MHRPSQVLPFLPAPLVCRKASNVSQQVRPRWETLLWQGLPAAASGASSFLPAQVTSAGQTCLHGTRKRPTWPCQALLSVLEVSGHWCQDAANSKGARGFFGLALHVPPTRSCFCGNGQERPPSPFTELGSGLA